jgi:hypothetical protein
MRLSDTWDREAGFPPASAVVSGLGVPSFSTLATLSQLKTSESIFLNILFDSTNDI